MEKDVIYCNDIEFLIKNSFDNFVYRHDLKMETDADKALAIALFTNKITYYLMDYTDIHPEEVNDGN